MASIYKIGNKIYLSWYDSIRGKRMNKSTKLDYNKKNLKRAKSIAKQFQQSIKDQIDVYKTLGIKSTSIKASFEHFLKVNNSQHFKTIRDYKRLYKFFTKHFNEQNSCVTLNKLSIEDWLIEIKKLPLQPNSIFSLFK